MKRVLRAYILVTAKPGTSEEIVKAIRNMRKVEGIKFADSVYGRFDAIIGVEVEDLEELTRLTYEIIERLPNIIHTETLITLT